MGTVIGVWAAVVATAGLVLRVGEIVICAAARRRCPGRDPCTATAGGRAASASAGGSGGAAACAGIAMPAKGQAR